MAMKKDTFFYNSRGRRLPARIYYPEKASGDGVIFSHGLFSTRDGYKITGLADDITATGHTLLAFDFSCTPESGGSFSDLSVRQEVEDLAEAVMFFREKGIGDVHLMGSSMGGAVSLLCTAQGLARPLSLILIATPVRLVDVLAVNITCDVADLPHDGYTLIDDVRVKNTFFHEVNSLDIESLLPGIKIPALVLHGTDDRVVNFRNAEKITSDLGGAVKLVAIEGGDHNLTDDNSMIILRSGIMNWLSGRG